MVPMTGRAAGYCADYPVPGYMNPVPGRVPYGGYYGVGRGRYPWGGGRGFGWRSTWTPPLYGAYVPPVVPYAY